MSEDEKLRQRATTLDEHRISYGVAPFEYPSLRRWIAIDEIASVMVPCLRERGFVVSGVPGGNGVTGAAPGSQNEAYGRAYVECEAMYTVDPRLSTVNPSPAQKGIIYDYYAEFVIPCVRSQGMTIPDLPSREVWVANPQVLEGYPFGTDLQDTCPIIVPPEAFLGE